MSTALWVLVAVLAIVAAVAVIAMPSPVMQRRRLRERFGPTYDRAIADEGDRRSAERRLAAVVKRRESLDIRPLPERDRRSFVSRWNEIQSSFVDQPASAAGQADKLITEVVHARGYPVEDFDTRADLLATDHSQAVEGYRVADALRKRNGEPGAAADTEELRTALVGYRGLFELLVGLDSTRDPGYADLGSDRTGRASRAGRTGRQEKSGAQSAVLHGSARGRADQTHSE